MKLNTIAIGALGGFITAFLVDFQAWKSWEDAQFNIGVASFRWVQGLIIGASVAAGYGQ
jgi:hypothetical protein